MTMTATININCAPSPQVPSAPAIKNNNVISVLVDEPGGNIITDEAGNTIQPE